jgi:hypothetical protein
LGAALGADPILRSTSLKMLGSGHFSETLLPNSAASVLTEKLAVGTTCESVLVEKEFAEPVDVCASVAVEASKRIAH